MNTTSHRNRRWSSLVWLLLAPLLSGCGGAIVGHWHMVESVPNRDVFSIDQLEFRKDGTFSATTTIEGLTTDESGTYKFIGYQLKLRPQAGGQRLYSTTLRLNRLEILDGDRKVVLKKGRKGG